MGINRSELVLTKEQAIFYRRIKMMAIRKQPYIATAINNLIPVNCPELKTAAVDKSYRLYIDMEYMMSRGYEYAAGVLAHEPWHILRKHSERAEKVGVRTSFEREIFNNATDLEINDDILDLIPEEGIKPEEGSFIDFKAHKNAEDYYFQILDIFNAGKQEPKDNNKDDSSGESDKPVDSSPEGSTGDKEQEKPGIGEMMDALKNNKCGSGSGGSRLEDYELDEDEAPSVSDFQATIIRKKVAEAIKNTSDKELDADSMKSESLKLWAEEVLNHAPIDWRTVFNSNLRNAVKFQSGYSDYDRRKVARRQPIQGILLPARSTPTARVGLGIDTSGSNIEKLGVAVEEIMGIIEKVGVRGRDLLAFSVDENIEGEPDYITKREDISFTGSGGTDLNKAFDYVSEKLSKKIDIFVLLTDGEYDDWYEQKPLMTGRISFIVVIIVDSKKEPAVASRVIENAENKLKSWANVLIIDISKS